MASYLLDEKWASKAGLHAGNKARCDIETIARASGIKTLQGEEEEFIAGGNILRKCLKHWKARGDYFSVFEKMARGDALIVQVPLVKHTVFTSSLVHFLHNRQCNLIVLIHDLDSARLAISGKGGTLSRQRAFIEEKGILAHADAIICHNPSMARYLQEQFGIEEKRLVTLDIFDYLVDEKRGETDTTGKHDLSIVIAGNLSPQKAGYAYQLPMGCNYRLYGVNWHPDEVVADNIDYVGAFPPDELPEHLLGGYGLVWDGDSIDTCTGVYGRYLELNDPHKASLYLASGLPVVIWRRAALAPFIERNGLGLAVDSLCELADVTRTISDAQYVEMVTRVREFALKLRTGWFTRRALSRAGTIVGEPGLASLDPSDEGVGLV